MIADLQTLWQEAFHEPDDFADLFFTRGFSPERYHRIVENGRPVSALYWFDCSVDGKPVAYLYGIATAKAQNDAITIQAMLTQRAKPTRTTDNA